MYTDQHKTPIHWVQ